MKLFLVFFIVTCLVFFSQAAPTAEDITIVQQATGTNPSNSVCIDCDVIGDSGKKSKPTTPPTPKPDCDDNEPPKIPEYDDIKPPQQLDCDDDKPPKPKKKIPKILPC